MEVDRRPCANSHFPRCFLISEQREPDFYEMSKKYPLLGSLDAPPFKNEEASISRKHAPSLSSSSPVETPSRSSNSSAGNCLHGYPHGYHTPGPSYLQSVSFAYQQLPSEISPWTSFQQCTASSLSSPTSKLLSQSLSF